jgi:hypothetical protein
VLRVGEPRAHLRELVGIYQEAIDEARVNPRGVRR